jgi:hypothetical protein
MALVFGALMQCDPALANGSMCDAIKALTLPFAASVITANCRAAQVCH